MEQLKIIFFALTSFFGVEDGQIAAEKTSVTIYPKQQQVKIIQEELFTIILPGKDIGKTLNQWNMIFHNPENKRVWAKELANFPTKSIRFKIVKEMLQPQINLTYTDFKDLRNLGIWHQAKNNSFFINQIPRYHIKTNQGKLTGKYWEFKDDEPFTFTIEPFLKMPKKYLEKKVSLKDLLKELDSTNSTRENLTRQTEWYYNGQMRSEGFKNSIGNKVGKWSFYREDGVLDMVLTYNNLGSLKGPFELYYKNGKLQKKCSYSGEVDYEMDGACEDYYQNGQLKSKGVYKKGKIIGKWEKYWNNGQLKRIVEYTPKGIVKLNRAYYENGQLFTETHFDDKGNKKGMYKSYYQNGQLQEKGAYAGIDFFQKKGTWETYYKNGNIKSKITYNKEGEPVGEIKMYPQK